MDDSIGKQLGNYRLIRRLGHGGFGDVYLGQHVHLERHAAIKVLHAHLTRWGEEAFRAEAQRLVDLEHPNIVRIFDFGIEAGISYLVMEYAPNGSLRERHAPGSCLPLDTIVFYVKHLADALQYIHERKLIHRDIKPANVLLGSKNNLLLSDVGLAIVSHSTDSFSLQQIAGTPAYMAPEQAQGMAVPASDQYSLGVMVYEWLCGELPFISSNRDGKGVQKELEEQHKSVLPPPLRRKIPTIPPLLETVVLTALSKEPQGRFVNVQAFANALEQVSRSVLFTSPASQVPALSLGPSSPSNVVAPASGQSSTPIDAFAGASPPQSSLTTDVITPLNQSSLSNSSVKQTGASFPASKPSGGRRTGEIPAPPVTQGNPRRKTGPRWSLSIALLLFALFLIFAGSGYAVLGSNLFLKKPVVTSTATPASTASATITITPASKDLKKSYTVSAVTGKPDISKHQVGARLLSSTTPSYTKTVNATGTKTTAGSHATGILTLLNFTNSPETFNAGMVIDNAADAALKISMMLDATVTVPASNETTTVPAHVVQVGTIGNIDSFVFCTPHCGASPGGSYRVENQSPFSGGKDPQTYTVVKQSDIDSAANALETANTPNAQQVVQGQVHTNEQLAGNPQCQPDVTSDHAAGEVANTLTVAVTFTCTGDAYDRQGALAAAEQWLKQDAVQNPGAGYVLVGNVVTKQTQAQESDTNQGTIAVSVTAEGVWVYQFGDFQKHALAKLIAGKKKEDAQALLLRQPGVAQVTIELSGGGGETMPTDLSQIKLVALSVQGKST